MNIILKEIEKPFCREFQMFGKIDADKLKETKTVTITTKDISKTRISVGMQIGNWYNSINLKVEGFKQFEETSFSYADYKKNTSYYFVKSKAQNYEAFKKYVIELVKQAFILIGIEMDSIIIELETPKEF